MGTFIFSSSPTLRDLQRKIGHIVRTQVPVLIEGETGTGKEILARHIHSMTPHAGAFTRFVCATGNAQPILEEAAKAHGWIFFKYVDRLDSAAQEQLQAVIDRCWGGNWERIVCSSSQPLESLAVQRRFSAPLYHHLAGVTIVVPPLRDQKADVPGLFEALVREYAINAGMDEPVVSDELRSVLSAHNWPGNVRELSNLAAIFAVSANDLDITAELRRRSETMLPAAPARLPLKEQIRKASRELESGIILRTLENHRWNRRRTAETLHISYRSLLYKMKACNLRGENTGAEVSE